LREPPAPIERTDAGDFVVRLSPEERDLLRRLAAELEELLAEEPADPSLRRLRPRAYEDEEVEREFRALMGAELEADRWLAALNDLRLVLGTRLDVTEDLFADGFDSAAPNAYELAVYAFLTWVQEAAVQAAAGNLGAGSVEDD
jgi:hypothetical protein